MIDCVLNPTRLDHVRHLTQGTSVDAMLICSEVHSSPGAHKVMIPMVLKHFLGVGISCLCPCFHGGGTQSLARNIWIVGIAHETITLAREIFCCMGSMKWAHNLSLTLSIFPFARQTQHLKQRGNLHTIWGHNFGW